MDRAGYSLAKWLGAQFDWSREDEEVAAFSLTLIISSTFFIGVLLLFSSLAGVRAEALTMAAASGLLRTFAGGAHLSTGWRCGIISSVAATLVAWIAQTLGPTFTGASAQIPLNLTILVTLGIASAMLRWAPQDVPQKPIASPRQRRRLKRLSILIPFCWGIGAAWLLTQDSASAGSGNLYGYWLASGIGLMWETFSVAPPGTCFVRWLDRQIEHMARAISGPTYKEVD